MSQSTLPAELWSRIFHLASDDDLILQYGLPTKFSEYAWFRKPDRDWSLRSPQEAVNLLQRRSYFTKKSIVSTCRFWNTVGQEFLYRSLYFEDPAKLQAVSTILDAPTTNPLYGWWTRRVHVTRHNFYLKSSFEIGRALVSLIRHCPNLEIFIIETPLDIGSFAAIAHALATHANKSLRTIHFHVPTTATDKVIWMLASLPNVSSVHLTFQNPQPPAEEEEIDLGAANDLSLVLPYLSQLLIVGSCQAFLEQATLWTLPALRAVLIDVGIRRTALPDIPAFLTAHGSSLVLLDIDSVIPVSVPIVLDLCPSLTTFAFNADWRLEDAGSDSEDDYDSEDEGAPTLVNRPHTNISLIGLHGLTHAFGVSPIPATFTLKTVLRRRNDRTFTALQDRYSFPKLKAVRALSVSVLSDLEKADGPSEDGGGIARYDRWFNGLNEMGVVLEDCTGGAMGVLPVDSDDEDSDEEAEIWEDETGFHIEVPPPPEEEPPNDRVTELRQLLEECRVMEREREEEEANLGSFGALGGFSPVGSIRR